MGKPFPVLIVTIKKSAKTELEKAFYKLKDQAKEKCGVDVRLEWEQRSPLEAIITILKDISDDHTLAAAIWALVFAFLIEIGKIVLKRKKNQSMAYAQATHHLRQQVNLDLELVELVKSEEQAGGRFVLVFSCADKRYYYTISRNCEVEKYSARKVKYSPYQ